MWLVWSIPIICHRSFRTTGIEIHALKITTYNTINHENFRFDKKTSWFTLHIIDNIIIICVIERTKYYAKLDIITIWIGTYIFFSYRLVGLSVIQVCISICLHTIFFKQFTENTWIRYRQIFWKKNVNNNYTLFLKIK